ncbi:MAG: CGGC domain-containing protein [Deltaproteobacteria bacterium]|nr:CGGC domain-containing protein [Deltaproteobacteria bacterium]
MKIGLIRCEKNETKCPLTSCFKALSSKQEGFSGYDSTELIGVFTCRCPGDNVTNLAKILKSKGAERVHMCTCMFAHKEKDGWALGQGFCPDVDRIVQQAAHEAGIPCVKGSAHLPAGYVPEVFE